LAAECDSTTDAARRLKDIDAQLAYLALLTQRQIKPLSRWEKPLEPKQIALLENMRLRTARVKRTVETAQEITETIFSTSQDLIELYRTKFENKPVDKSPATARFEGFLFGYPPCCVEQYISHPYARNDLPAEQQKILFHWACKNCPVTSSLLPVYVEVYEQIKKL
jgi:hypothetical protein